MRRGDGRVVGKGLERDETGCVMINGMMVFHGVMKPGAWPFYRLHTGATNTAGCM